MSQSTARHDPHAKSQDEDVADLRARQPERKQGVRHPEHAGQQSDDGGLIGDDDLGPADLGPLGPHADPDADSGRIRKIAGESGRDTGTRQHDPLH